MINRILEILEARWLIHRDTAISYLPLFISFLNGQKFSLSELEEKENQKSKILSFKASERGTEIIEYGFDNMDIPENSIAVIPIMGTLLSWKSMRLERDILLASANPRIIAILFVVNSPGGMVFYTDILATRIKQAVKPTIAAIQNIAASGAMWLISAMDYRIATSPMDWIGSIGVMTTFTDLQVLLKEKLGINITDIYASKSSRKNEMARALREGNLEPIIKDLDFVNEIFHKTIRENLSIAEDSEIFTGAIYNAEQAMEHKLIHEINSMDYAVDYAYQSGLIHKISHFQI